METAAKIILIIGLLGKLFISLREDYKGSASGGFWLGLFVTLLYYGFLTSVCYYAGVFEL